MDKSADVAYGSAVDVHGAAETLAMDVYQPRGDALAERPLIIFVHGGGFVGGDKATAQFVTLCTEFARRGYVTASINYRLDTNATTRAIMNAMHDARAAVRFFRAHTGDYRLDTARIAMGGGSAGAYTSLCTAYVDRAAELYPGSGAADVEGASGNPGWSSKIHACLDYWGALLDTAAIASSADPPLIIIHGTDDNTVPFSNAVKLHARADHIGLYNEYYPLQGEGHGPWGSMDSIVNATARFLWKVLIGGMTAVEEGRGGARMPAAPALHAPFPNPCRGGAIVSFRLARRGRIQLRIIDVLGREIALLEDAELEAGEHRLAWNAAAVPRGVYRAVLAAGGAVVTQPLLVTGEGR